VFLFMGPVMVMGAYFVQTETWSSDAFLASLPIAFLVTAILHANNIRDIDSDRRVGKRTLATLIGRRWANVEMYVLLVSAYAFLVLGVALSAIPWPALIALVTIPGAIAIAKVCAEGGSPKKLNVALFKSAQLHQRFGLVMSLGVGVAILFDAI
jgi:1,4-dihydroxy-2-naphthoate polyprenyltransferase